MRRWICVLLLASLTGCGSKQAGKGGESLSEREIAARFYYDLGPEAIDVSGYPEEQKKNYAVFILTCGQCHSPARPINAPIVKRADWQRYVHRMRERTKTRKHSVEIDARVAPRIIDFLAYDSQVRKVRRREEFAARTAELKKEFARVRKVREELRAKKNREDVKVSAPYVGAKPGH